MGMGGSVTFWQEYRIGKTSDLGSIRRAVGRGNLLVVLQPSQHVMNH
jgi:hypothetical protein